jgi:transposase
LVADVPQGHWHVTTMIGAVRLTGLVAGLIFEGATDTEAFAAFVERALVPQLQPGDVVVMDNLSSHKAPGCARRSKARRRRCGSCRRTRRT